tara:strand:+ start:5987 stop:6574 length:588 start_codon:yes stop_codon:yes gene_type:complete
MAKVHFFYSTMNAGKSTALLQSAHNYHETGNETILFIPREDADKNSGLIKSRIGLSASAVVIDSNLKIFEHVKEELKNKQIDAILVDEAQFLKKHHVLQMCRVCDELGIPVMCYGIRTDFRGELFEGSGSLLALADNLIELKTVCNECSRKATMVVRLNEDGRVVTEGSKVQIGGNDVYRVLCRKHFNEATKLLD